jgi:hypothetical protein
MPDDMIVATLNENGELHSTSLGFYGACNATNCTWVTDHDSSRRRVQWFVRRHLGMIGDPAKWKLP